MLNKYEVIGVIGEGAYGIVLKCRHKETQEIVAIKKFKESDDDEVVRKTTLREVKILRMLKQDNVVNMYEAFKRKGKLYLVFEHVERNMLEVLDQEPAGLAPDMVRLYTYQLLKAITYCHNLDIVHRDIKPENLLLSSEKVLKLCDFGFARSVGGSHKNSELTEYVATRWYRAPELLLGTTHYGKPVDIWAVGCIVGEMATGQPVFPGESEIDQLYIIQRIVGALTTEQTMLFLQNPRFAGFKFPDMSNPETIRKKYANRIEEQALDLMISMLQMDSSKRPTGDECMMHPFFDSLREADQRNNTSAQDPLLSPTHPFSPSSSSLHFGQTTKSPSYAVATNAKEKTDNVSPPSPRSSLPSAPASLFSPPSTSHGIQRMGSNQELAAIVHVTTHNPPEIPMLDLKKQEPAQFQQQQLQHLLQQHLTQQQQNLPQQSLQQQQHLQQQILQHNLQQHAILQQQQNLQQQQQIYQQQPPPKSRKKSRQGRRKTNNNNNTNTYFEESYGQPIQAYGIADRTKEREKEKEKEKDKAPKDRRRHNDTNKANQAGVVPALSLDTEKRSKMVKGKETSPLKPMPEEEHVEYIEISARAVSRKAQRQPTNNTMTARNTKGFTKFAPQIPPEPLPRIHDDELGQELSSLSFSPPQPPTAPSHPLSNSGGGGGYGLYSTNSMKIAGGGGGEGRGEGRGAGGGGAPYMNLAVKGNVKMPSLVKQK